VFESFYFGALHHPLWSWVSVVLVFAVLRGLHGSAVRFQDPFIRLFVIVFGVEIALDAWCTGAWSPLGDAGLAQNIAILFVILGDLRYFVLVERYATGGSPRDGASPWLRALGWALIIPILSGLGARVFPEFFASARWIYLVYELMFLALALVLGVVVLPKRLDGVAAPVRRFVLALTWFQAAQYALWAYADVVILSFGDVGYAFRLIPNAFYYALFLPFVLTRAPRLEPA
jgi:hypothetical protein